MIYSAIQATKERNRQLDPLWKFTSKLVEKGYDSIAINEMTDKWVKHQRLYDPFWQSKCDAHKRHCLGR